MKTKIGYFLGGFVVCLVLAILRSEMTNPYTRTIGMGNPERTARFAQFLDDRQIWYTYEINHLKRHGVRPHIKSQDEIEKLVDTFHATDQKM